MSRLQQLLTPEKKETTLPVPTSGSRLRSLIKAPTIPEEQYKIEPQRLIQPTFKTSTPAVALDAGVKPSELFPSTEQAIGELGIDPLSLQADPKKAVSTAFESLKDTIATSALEIRDVFQLKDKKPSKVAGEALEAGAAVGHIVFSPISALFEGANQVPVLGSVSKLISLPFIAAGEAGTQVAKGIVDNLPVDDEVKKNIGRGVEEIFALASQLAIGKVTHIGTKKTKELVKSFGEKDAQTIIKKSNELAQQAKEPIVEPVKSRLVVKDGKIEPVKPEVKPTEPVIPTKAEVPIEVPVKPEIKPKRKFVDVPREQLPVKTAKAEKGVSALEARMKGILGIFKGDEAKSIRKEAEIRGVDLSLYDKVSKPEQLRESAKYVDKTPQYKVLEILEGKREAPKGLLHNAIMIALEAKSLRDKNVDLAVKLASLRSTRAGQEISILTEVEGTSPISGMQEIIRARRDVSTKKLKQGETISTKRTETVKKIKTEQTKLQLKMSEVSKILDKITC